MQQQKPTQLQIIVNELLDNLLNLKYMRHELQFNSIESNWPEHKQSVWRTTTTTMDIKSQMANCHSKTTKKNLKLVAVPFN